MSCSKSGLFSYNKTWTSFRNELGEGSSFVAVEPGIAATRAKTWQNVRKKTFIVFDNSISLAINEVTMYSLTADLFCAPFLLFSSEVDERIFQSFMAWRSKMLCFTVANVNDYYYLRFGIPNFPSLKAQKGILTTDYPSPLFGNTFVDSAHPCVNIDRVRTMWGIIMKSTESKGAFSCSLKMIYQIKAKEIGSFIVLLPVTRIKLKNPKRSLKAHERCQSMEPGWNEYGTIVGFLSPFRRLHIPSHYFS